MLSLARDSAPERALVGACLGSAASDPDIHPTPRTVQGETRGIRNVYSANASREG